MNVSHLFLALLIALPVTPVAAQLAPAAVPAASDDPFGAEVKIPDEIKKAKAKKAGKKDQQPTPETAKAEPPRDPFEMKLHLQDQGTTSVVAGKLSVKEIRVETQYGTLTIPINKIRSFTPGLASNAELDQQIRLLIEQLGSNSFAEREQAHKSLLKLGPAIREELKKQSGDSNHERSRHIKLLLTELAEIADEAADESGEPLRAMIRDDTVRTMNFSVVGRILPREFQFHSKYGTLTVSLGDIRTATRDIGDGPENILRVIKVEGTHLAQLRFKNTRIRLKKGDRVSIRADGEIKMTPWGSSSKSSPDGGSKFGTYRSGIYSGTLVGRVGSGTIFKIGRSHTFTAKSAGVLELAIGMRSSYARGNYQFPGHYNVKIRVDRVKK
jgi:hypothetical protein